MAQADRLQERSDPRSPPYARGGVVAGAPRATIKSASLATALVGIGGLGGLNPVDLSKLLAGKIAQASPSIGDVHARHQRLGHAADLETALQLNYLAFTAPNLTPEAFELMKRRLSSALENQAQNPRARVRRAGRSDQHLEPLQREAADARRSAERSISTRCERSIDARFANAADFTFFFVGAFTVDEITPLLETLDRVAAVDREEDLGRSRDIGVQFPARVVTRDGDARARSRAARRVMSFFADTELDELEMHRARAAASVLSIRLRDILREELGGTYGVSVGFEQLAAAQGYGIDDGPVRQLARERREARRRGAEGSRAPEGARGRSPTTWRKVKELERRDLRRDAKQNAYWLGSLQTVHLLGWDPAGITRRERAHREADAGEHHEMFKKYFPTDRYTVVTLMPESRAR